MKQKNFTLGDLLSAKTQISLQIEVQQYQTRREVDRGIREAKDKLFKDLAKRRAAEKFQEREKERLGKIAFERLAGHTPEGKVIRPIKVGA